MIPLRPTTWVVNLALAGAVSYTSAGLTMQVFEQRLDADAGVTVAAGPAAVEQAEQEKLPESAFQPVLDANIFGAKRTEIKPSREIGPVDPAAGTPVAPPAALTVTLTGTMIMGERSFAMVADDAGRNEHVYRLWDCLPAAENHPTRTCEPTQGKLIAVRRKAILVRYQGEQLTFELTDKPAAPPPVARRSPQAFSPGQAPSKALSAQPDASAAPFPITQDGNIFDVRVPGLEVAKAFENFNDVLKQARVVPYTDESGQGFQIRNIRPGSIFDRIGLNNFDKIKAVNGEPITTADQALRLLTMFRNEREISLDLERKSEGIQLNYSIE